MINKRIWGLIYFKNTNIYILVYRVYLVYMKKSKKEGEKISTIKVKESTKKKLKSLNFARKDVSFDDIINKILDKIQKKR